MQWLDCIVLFITTGHNDNVPPFSVGSSVEINERTPRRKGIVTCSSIDLCVIFMRNYLLT